VVSLDEIFAGIFGGFARGVGPAVNDSLFPWLQKLGVAAITRWSGVIASGIRCAIPMRAGSRLPCGGQAIGGCACCGLPTCLEHAMVARTADVVCLKCINEYVSVVRERTRGAGPGRVDPPPQPQAVADHGERDRRKHLKTLELEDPTTPDEIKMAYRKLALQHHPDRAPEGEKKAATKKFMRVQAAYDFLMAEAERKVA